MAAVTTDQVPQTRCGERSSHPAKAAAVLYENTMGFLNAGYAEGGINGGANKFAGMVVNKVDNSAGSNGDKDVEFKRRGLVKFTGSGFAITDVGVTIYATDNFTVTKTSTNNVAVARIVEFVSATQVWGDIEDFAV